MACCSRRFRTVIPIACWIWESNPQFPQFAVAPGNYVDWQAQSTASFTSLAAVKPQSMTGTGLGEAQRLSAGAVTPNYAGTLGITPALGRFLALPSGGPDEVVIGYAFWQRQFGGTSTVLGHTLTLDGHPYTIVGAMPSGLPSGSFYDPDVWTRLPLDAPAQVDRGTHVVAVYGRLRDGVSEQQGERDLKTVAARLAVAYPQTNKAWSVVTMPLLQQILGSVRPALTLLFAAAACVLLIGAANLANLFLVRYLARERELALRTALGATRRRVVRELVIEALTLGTIACAVGVALAFGGVRALRVLAPATLPRLDQIGVDARVVAFCVVAALTTVCLFGLVPAWHASRACFIGAVKAGGRGTSPGRHHRLQDSLVVLQMAVALILLTGAGLFVAGFEHFRQLDPGFRPEGVLTALVTPLAERYATPEKQTGFVSRLLEQLSAIPGVLGVSVSNNLPTTLVWAAGFTVVGDPPPDPAHMPTTDLACVSPGYFRTMGMDLRRGRGVLATNGQRAPEVMVVDGLFARRFFSGRDPVGQRLAFGSDTASIVGVVAPVKQRGLAGDNVPVSYAPLAQCPMPGIYVEVRAADPAAMTAAVKHAIQAVDPTAPISDVETMTTRMAASMGSAQFSSFLASLFAAVALVLSVVGLYSVLAFVVTQRQREIGVRLALGASHGHVMSDVLRRASILAGLGIAIGGVGAWILARLLAGLVVGVSPHNPVIFAGAVAAFAVVALAAASVPAYRTTRVNPVVALTST